MAKILIDNNGKRKRRTTVEQLAVDNVIHSMSLKELAEYYVDSLNDFDLMQWATDAEGNFSR